MCPNDRNCRARHICSKPEASISAQASQGVFEEEQSQFLQGPANLSSLSSSHPLASDYSPALQGLSQMSIHNTRIIHMKDRYLTQAECNMLSESNDPYSERGDLAHAPDARFSAPRTPISHAGVVTLNIQEMHWDLFTAHASHLQNMKQMMVPVAQTMGSLPAMGSVSLQSIYDANSPRSSAKSMVAANTYFSHDESLPRLGLEKSSVRSDLHRAYIPPTDVIVNDEGLPDPRLGGVVASLRRQRWLARHEEEPSMDSDEEDVRRRFLPGQKGCSRFDLFYDQGDGYRCRWVVDGTRCTHTAKRKDRALSHARDHLGYKPFDCSGECGNPGCLDRYTCRSSLRNHIKRVLEPMRVCDHCNHEFTTQNLRRHINTCK